MMPYNASYVASRAQHVQSAPSSFKHPSLRRSTFVAGGKGKVAVPVLDAIDGLPMDRVVGAGQRLSADSSLGLETMLRNLHFHPHDTPRRSSRKSSLSSPLTNSFTTADFASSPEKESDLAMDVDEVAPSRERTALSPVQPHPRHAPEGKLSPDETNAKMLEMITQITPPVTMAPKHRIRRSFGYSQSSLSNPFRVASPPQMWAAPMKISQRPSHHVSKRRRDDSEDSDEELEAEHRMSGKRLRLWSARVAQDVC